MEERDREREREREKRLDNLSVVALMVNDHCVVVGVLRQHVISLVVVRVEVPLGLPT